MTLLIIDIGSSSVRTLLFNDDATLIEDAIISQSHDFQTDNGGRAVADAQHLQDLVETCLDDILKHPAATHIRAVGMATFAGNWVGLDDHNQAITSVMTYADTGSRDDIAMLYNKLDGDTNAYHQATGCMLHTAYLPAQYHSFQRTQPELIEQIRTVTDIGGYLYRQWFKHDIPISTTIAGWLGLLHTSQLDWHTGYISQFDCDALLDCLPPVTNYDTVQSGLSDEYIKRWQVLKDVPFFLAVGDGAVANVGSGAVDPQHMALTIGTTSALRIVKDIEHVPDGLWRYLVCDGKPLVGGATSEGGNVYQWVIEELGLDPMNLESALADRLPDNHGLTILPLLAGERSPGWHSDASGTIHGIRRNTSKLDILQSHLEAVAIRLSLIAELLKDDDITIMAGGGALQSSPTWMQMIANAFDAPIQSLAEPELTARGVALMLLHSLDELPLDALPPKIETTVYPNPEHVTRFQSARARQMELYQRLYNA
jgi:gluconokinase